MDSGLHEVLPVDITGGGFMTEPEDRKSKGKKPRLRSMKAMLAEVLDELSAISHDPEQSKSKQANAVFVKADLLSSLLNAQSNETRARIKSGRLDEDEKPEPKEQKTEPSVPPLTFEERLARRVGQ
jgi:hypothetical protein